MTCHLSASASASSACQYMINRLMNTIESCETEIAIEFHSVSGYEDDAVVAMLMALRNVQRNNERKNREAAMEKIKEMLSVEYRNNIVNCFHNRKAQKGDEDINLLFQVLETKYRDEIESARIKKEEKEEEESKVTDI
jgi:hypothetical protein